MKLLSTLFAICLASSSYASDHVFDINISKKVAEIQPTMYGIFFEDINYGADGGLYAEMVKNRSFEFSNPLQGWQTTGNVTIQNDGPFERNPHYVRLGYSGHRVISTSLQNEGFFGVSVKKDEKYLFSVWARCPEGGKSSLEVQIVNEALDRNQHHIGRKHIVIEGREWKKYELELTALQTCEDAKLRIFLHREDNGKPESAEQVAVTDLEHISLFPADTWKGRKGGMRKDLAQALYDLHPGVFRFPGGCIVEGTNLEDRYQWKNTVGPVENRPTNLNRWQFEFDYRFYPDYYQSGGLGFFEYFQLAEDFGAAPLPVLNCGMTCQYENDIKDEAKYHVAVEDLDPYIQDAVDLVEFANGGTDTRWGALRAQMGHPEPFGLKFIAIGNEQWDYADNPAYSKRLKRFVDVMRVKCPEIKIIGTTGPDSEGEKYDRLKVSMTDLKVDLYDEHFYRNEEWFLSSGLRYDNYDRKGPKVFAGEYACHGKGNYPDGKEKKCNHFETSLYEAAFMTCFERNADIVQMCTYAPLFAHVKGWQWRPDLIWFDNMRMMKSCSYYVQQLYGQYKGTNVLSLTMDKQPVANQEGQDGLFASACYDAQNDAVIVKIANTSSEDQTIDLRFTGKKKDLKADFASMDIITFKGDLDAENTLDNPEQIVPVKQSFTTPTKQIAIKGKSFMVCVFKRK